MDTMIKKNIIYIFLLLTVSHSVMAVTKTYTGNGNWNSSNSWTPSGVPAAADDVIIANNKNPNVNVNNAQCKSLTIQAGGSLLIGNSKKLTINNVSGLNIQGTFEINGGDITIVNNNTAFTIASGASVLWNPGANTAAGSTLFTKCTENFAATSTLIIKKWYDLNVALGSVVNGNLGNVTINGVSGVWQMKNTLQTNSIIGTLTITSSYIVLDNTGAISNTTIGNIVLANSSSFLDFYNGTHPGSFTVNTGNISINEGELDCFYTSGTGSCTFNLNGNLTMTNQGYLVGANGHDGTVNFNVSGNVNLTKSYFIGINSGSGNFTSNISGNLTTQKSGSTYSEFYGILDGNGSATMNISGDFNNQGYFDLIWNTGVTGVGNGNCSLTIAGAFNQSDGDFRGIWNATTNNSGSCAITIANLNFTGGIFMTTYSCSSAGVNNSLTVTGQTSITISSGTSIFRGNGMANLSSVANNSSFTLTCNGSTAINGNNTGEFSPNAGYGIETNIFNSVVNISGGTINFGLVNHTSNTRIIGAVTITGGTIYFSKDQGLATTTLSNNLTMSGGAVNQKNNSGKTTVSIAGNFSMSQGTYTLFSPNNTTTSDSNYVSVNGDFNHSGGSIRFSNNLNSNGPNVLFINGSEYVLSGNGNITTDWTGSATTFGYIVFANTTNTNWSQTSTSHRIEHAKYIIANSAKVTVTAGPVEIASENNAGTDFLNIISSGVLDLKNFSIKSNGISTHTGVTVGANGILKTANVNGIFDGTANAAINSTNQMDYSLASNSTIIYNGTDNQKVSGFGNGVATGAQHQYGNLVIDFNGTPNSEYVYLERSTTLRGSLSTNNGELRLNSFTLTAESASGSGTGYVKSEDNTAVNISRLKVGYTPSNKNLVFPFGKSSSEIIYLNLNITNNPGSGYVTISTRATGSDNTPLPGTDNVNAITNINPGGADVSTTHVIDRWWEVNAPGVTADYTLRYSSAENTTTGSTTTGPFNIQFWNGGNFTKFNSTGNGVTTGVGAISANLTNINGPLVLSSGSASLPIKLVQFDAKATGKVVEITWTTAEEKNNDYFNIERSENGQSFEKIEEIDGAGNSNSILKYKTTDDHPLPGITYYRLKQTDFDGKFTYSPIRAVNRGEASAVSTPSIEVISFGPNPFSEQFNVNYQLTQGGETKIMLFNMNGQVVFETDKFDDLGSNSFQFTDDRNLAIGNYILQISNGSEKISKKIIKK